MCGSCPEVSETGLRSKIGQQHPPGQEQRPPDAERKSSCTSREGDVSGMQERVPLEIEETY